MQAINDLPRFIRRSAAKTFAFSVTDPLMQLLV
jgi:hypothetical protein